MRKHLTSRFGLVAALEDEEIQPVELNNEGEIVVADPAADPATPAEPVVVVEEPIGDNAESLETDLIEVAETEADVASADEEIADTVEAADDLEEVAAALESAALNGGIDKHSAAVVKVAVGKLYKQAGVRANAMPAMEAFSGPNTRIRATELALEDIKEKIVKIWQAIVAQIVRAIAWMKDFFEKVFVAARKLKERALKLKDRAKQVASKASGKKDGDDFESDKIAGALAINGTVPADVAKSLESLKKVAEEIFGGEQMGVAMTDAAVKSVDTIKSNPKAILDEATTTVPHVIGKKKTSMDGFAALPDNTEAYSSEELPGGRAIITIVPVAGLKGDARLNAVKHFSSKVEMFKGAKANPVTSNKVKFLEVTAAKKLAEDVAGLADALLAYKNHMSKTEASAKKLAAAGKQCGDAAAKATDAEDKKGFELAKALFVSAAANANAPGKQFAGYALNTGKAYLDLVEESLKHYK